MPHNCQTIKDVRKQIDNIDHAILKLFAERLKFVERIVDFKTDEKEVIARDRQTSVLNQRREWSENLGLDPNTFEQIFKLLIDHNIQRELRILNEQSKK